MRRSRDRLSIVVAGMLAGVPNHGGATWAVLQYILGFLRLGHDVTFVEEIRWDGPGNAPLGRSAAGRYFAEVSGRFGLDGRAALLRSGTDETVGISIRELRAASERADLLVNLSGVLRDLRLREAIPVRVYVDLDPGFTQMWAEDGIEVGLEGHTRHVTVGLEVGRAGNPIPTCDVTWITTLPPVVLERWPVGTKRRRNAFTTVANWRSYGSVRRTGLFYGQKAHSLRELIDLPGRTGERFELALSVHPGERADLADLSRNGWRLVDPAAAAGTPDRFSAFVRGSTAELGVAKSGYVTSRSGWFSERSACYLASGRPVVAQDTGFPGHLPVGEGLLAFRDADQAAGAVEAVRSRSLAHARAARTLAEEHFDSDRVLGRLLEQLACA